MTNIDRYLSPARREAPITLYLRRWLPHYFPILLEPGHGMHASGVGIHANRGRYHPTGRAADIYFNEPAPYEKWIADRIFWLFIQEGRRLGTDHVIWNRKIWSAAQGGPRHYVGTSPHTNHIHVYFTEEHSNQQPLWLSPMLARIASGSWVDGGR
jgi:hypothetical protein